MIAKIKHVFFLGALVVFPAVGAPLYLECTAGDSTFKVRLDENAQTATYYNVNYPEHVFQAKAKFAEDRVVYSSTDSVGFSHEIDRRTLDFKMKFGPLNNGEGHCKIVTPVERKF